jgi:hypothetical protein
LLKLKDEEGKGWAEVMAAFEEHGWGDRKLKLLKARYKALKEGSVFWEGGDVCLTPPIFVLGIGKRMLTEGI